MRITINRSITAVVFLAFSVLQAAAQVPPAKLADFSGMSGCWERRDDAKKILVSEQWMSPAGTSILGMGRTVKNGKTADFEFMRIEERTDGIYFVARPAANAEETPFKLKSSTANEAVFENTAHDFPQRVIYRWTPTTLTGRIEGNKSGKAMAIDFPMKVVSCNAAMIAM